MDKSKCEKLFDEYKSLRAEMDSAFQVHNMVPDRRLNISSAPPYEHMLRFDELKKLLLDNCKKCLSLDPSELHELGT